MSKPDLNSFGTEMIKCPICGISYENKKIGRTKEYCNDTCRLFNKYKNLMERELLKINFDDKNSRLIKGELFRLANLIKIDKVKKD